MRLQFETCVRQVEANGLIWRLSFGNLVLLQPELFDAHASSLINAAKQEVDGLGSISEAKVLAGNFSIPADERIKDREQEKLLLIALVDFRKKEPDPLGYHGRKTILIQDKSC